MTRWIYPPELERHRQRDRFDPVLEGGLYGLSRELSLAIWKQVCADATDSSGRRDEEQARHRFHELATRIAARSGRLRPDPGRVTRVGVEINGDSLSAWNADELRPRAPGRETLVAVEARRWMVPGERPTVTAASMTEEVSMAAPKDSDVPREQNDLPGATTIAQAMAELPPPPYPARASINPSTQEASWVMARPIWPGNIAQPSIPGRRTLVDHATNPRLGFDDYRVLGLRELLKRLGPDHPLRQEIIAAAAIADRPIAGRATLWSTRLPRATTPNGHALWHAAERHAVTLYRRAVNSGAVDQYDPAVESALQQRGTGQPLPIGLRREMERELGVSLGGVRIHTDAVAAQAARALDAEAFTVGEDIFFAEGTFAPATRSGRKLLAHEMTHVAQALRGETEPAADGLRVSQPGEPSELEADAVAERIGQIAALSPSIGPVAQSTASTGARKMADALAADAFIRGDGIELSTDAPSPGTHDGRLLLTHELAHMRQQPRSESLTIQRQKKNATSPVTSAKKPPPGDVVTAMRISGSKVLVTFQQSGTFQYTLVQNSLSVRAEPYHGTGKEVPPGMEFKVKDAVGEIVISFSGTEKEPDPASFKYADAFPITMDDGSNVSAVSSAGAGSAQSTPESTSPTIKVTDPKQIQILKQKGLIPSNQADQIAGKLGMGEKLTFEEALTLVDALNRVTSPNRNPDDSKDSWLQWARFIEKNKDRISEKFKASGKGKTIDETQALLDEYKEFVGVQDPPSTTLKTKIEEARKYDPQVAKAWNDLSSQEKLLWNAYLKDYGSTTKTSADRRTDLHPTPDDKMFMALNISTEYMPEGAAAQIKVLVNDPIFWASLMAGLTAYLLLWMAPEPIFTKAIAILTTISLLSVTGFAASQIIAVARAYMRLRDACETATTLDEIRGAAREFGHTIGAAGANVLVTLALLLGGKALPARPAGGPPSMLPEPVPVPAGGPGLPPPAVPVPAATVGGTTVPGYAIAIGPNGEIVYMTAKADQAAGGSGGGGKPAGKPAPGTTPEIAPDELPPDSPEAVTTKGTGSTSQGELVEGSVAHRAARWTEYQQRGGMWSYERWLKVYEANMTRADQANAAVRVYRDKLGWGKVEVIVDVEGVPRRLDIADAPGSRAVEVKTGAQYATQENLWEIARDEILIKQYGWDIRWHFEGIASGPLQAALKAAGIPFD